MWDDYADTIAQDDADAGYGLTGFPGAPAPDASGGGWGVTLSQFGGFLGDVGKAAVTFADARTAAERSRLQSDLTRAQLQGQVDLTRARTVAEVRRVTNPPAGLGALFTTTSGGASMVTLALIGGLIYFVAKKT